jgi:hypothetical protein
MQITLTKYGSEIARKFLIIYITRVKKNLILRVESIARQFFDTRTLYLMNFYGAFKLKIDVD